MLREIRIASFLGMFLAVATQAGVVKVHGALKVQGNHVVDANGNPIQVAGMSLYWPEWGGNAFYTASAVQTMASSWDASVIRAPFPVYTPNSTPADQYNASNESLIKTVVDAAIANDIYVIVDWHVEGDNVEEDHAKTFFGDIAKAYPNSPNVIWEIWNEPISASWSTIKSYASDILAVIRPYSSNLVIVGSPTWSHTPNTPAADPITTDPNIAYTTHFYACSDSTAERATVTAAAAKIPIFFTEWGTTASDGNTGFCTGESDQWLALAKQLGISWTNWSLSNKGGGSAALTSTDVNGGLSASGTYVKAKIQAVYAAISTTSGTTNPPPADTLAIPGHIEAESYTSLSTEGIKAETVGGVTDLGYTSNGSWAEYLAKITQTGTYTLAARVASDAAGTLTFKWNGNTLGSMQVASTGGWNSWQTQDLSVQLNSSGAGTLRVEWSGSGSSLVNLDWVEFAAVDAGLATGRASSGFSVQATAHGLSVTLPSGSREVQVTDLQGRTLVRRSISGQRQMRIGLDGQGLVLVRLSGAAGEAVLPVLLSH